MILEYLEETDRPAASGRSAARAEHRAWIEFGSTILSDIAGFYAAADEATFKAKTAQLAATFARLESAFAAPWFARRRFSLVDAVFGPVFRYFDVFDEIGDFGILPGKPKLATLAQQSWRQRPSVRTAVGADYPELLRDFIARRSRGFGIGAAACWLQTPGQ